MKPRCASRTWRNSGNWGAWHDCRRVGTVEEDGRYWCGHHAPSRVKARDEAKDIARRRAESIDSARAVVRGAERDVVAAAMRAWADNPGRLTPAMETACTALSVAMAMLADAEGKL